MAVSENRMSETGPILAGDIDIAATAILLDVDGTLIEIAATPEAVRVPPSLVHTLARLRDKLEGALCLVSGRPIAVLDRLFSPLRVAIVGGHGAEARLSPHGMTVRSRVHPIDPELRQRLLAIAGDTPGLLAESKEYSVALHYRLAPELEHIVRDQVEALCDAYGHGAVEVLPGKSVFEVKPVGFNKGIAIREVMRHAPFAGRTPIFMGDDVTDESGFAAVGELGGLGFSVGRRLPKTKGLFGTPREVRSWLYALLRGPETG
jgi:trehalose 6-phosphate phosphatase